mmetsp:Transcript_38092/g.76335  ORF Transcript_38092/g.76335 Transcript_38092/m.76335 type:complete len:202 (-) Transcript_38092:853-1458(-)
MLWHGFSLVHPSGRAEACAGVRSRLAQLLLDAQQLIVLGETLGAAGRAGLDLACAEADGEVGDVGILGLTGPVRSHHAPARCLGILDGLDRLGNRSDLVDLEQQSVGCLFFDRAGNLGGVRHGQVVANDLHVLAELGHHVRPILPIVLVEAVLDRNDREVLDHAAVDVHQLGGRDLLRCRVPRAKIVQRAFARGAVLNLEL